LAETKHISRCKTDGVALETGLASAMDNATTGIRLSKNGAALADRNDATVPAYDAMGCYRITLSATDTNTLGTLRMIFEEAATCLPVWQDFMVVPVNVWDSFFGADALQVDTVQVGGTTQTAGNLQALITTVDTVVDGIQTDLSNGTDGLGAIKADTAAILIDTAEIGAAGAGLTAINLPDQTMNITGNITGNLSGSVGSLTGHTAQTGDTFALANGVNGFVATKADTAAILVDTADMQPKLGTPAADLAADVAAVKAETALIVADTNELQTDDVPGLIAAVQADTNDIQARLPVALSGGNMAVDVLAVSGSTAAADALELSTEAIVVGAAQTGTLSTTTMTTNLTISAASQYNGRILIFQSDTTTAALRNQATDITATIVANGELGFTALTTAPVNGDTFIIV
jgi:hypothetical protein